MSNETTIGDSWHSYPSVYALGHPAIDGILDGAVVIEEKIDGSQFSFGVFDGGTRCRSKGKMQPPGEHDHMFNAAVETVGRLAPTLHPGWTYRGEFLGNPKHNTLRYERVPKQHIIIFDINTDNEHYLTPDEKAEEAARIGLEVVPLLDVGGLSSIDDLDRWLQTESILGGTTIEGVVVKNYRRFGRNKKVLMGKFVSEAFKETNKENWGKPKRADVLTKIRERYRTEARWAKAVQHLRDAGTLECSPRDIGALIVEAQNDVHKECAGEIKDVLFATFWPDIKRGLTAGLPDWYKRQLAASAMKKDV